MVLKMKIKNDRVGEAEKQRKRETEKDKEKGKTGWWRHT